MQHGAISLHSSPPSEFKPLFLNVVERSVNHNVHGSNPLPLSRAVILSMPMLGKARIEALSDAIFAVAMTILIFNVQTPRVTDGGLTQALLTQWPSYAAYAGTFFTVGVAWLNHHDICERLVGMNRTLVVINLVLLMAIVFLPFSTSVLGSYVSAPHDAHVAATLYALTFLFLAICFTLFWVYSLTQPQLLAPGFDRAVALRRLRSSQSVSSST